VKKLLLALAGAMLALPSSAAESNIRSLVFETRDLVFTVQDLYRVVESTKETTIELPADVLFDFDKAEIRPDAADALKAAARILRERAKGPVRVEGHTDAKGSSAYNQNLSEQRANAVKQWLAEREGLSDMAFTIKGLGATKPAVPNTKPDGTDDPEGRQKNRRVALVFGK
jgi:outer membrane protein OmpA-like peptidoglycan-associated protein